MREIEENEENEENSRRNFPALLSDDNLSGDNHQIISLQFHGIT